MEAERALRSIRGGDVRKEEEEERRESEGSGRHRRGGAKLALLPPIFELKIILEEPQIAPFDLSHEGELGAHSSVAYFANMVGL